jgi:uncharacterized membrane protein YecN with MAPEG domain
MTILPITLTIAAAAALLNLWLGSRVSRVRMAAKVLTGDGGHPLLTARMRAHANYVEYTPFVLILLALVELARGAQLWLWAVAIVYILGRILHAFGMDSLDKPARTRIIGILVTWVVLIALAGYALYIGYAATLPARPTIIG